MKTKDINFFNFPHPKHYRDIIVNPYAGTVTEGGSVHQLYPPTEETAYSDAVKGGNSTDSSFTNYRFGDLDNVLKPSGTEDCLDLNNRCQRLKFTNGVMVSGLKNCITIKGGCEDIEFDDLLIFGRPHTHIDLGNHSDQFFGPNKRIRFKDVRCADNQPIILRVGLSDKPVMIETNVKELVWEGRALKVYVFAKHFFPAIP